MDEMNPFASAALSVAQNNAWSAEQAQKQMDFQERMSNTAHVREIADLKAAGLNPVLSAKLGGASTPSGAMATGDMSGTSAIVSLFDRMLDNQSAEKLLQMRLDNSNEQLEKKFDFEREMTAMNNAVAAAESAGKASSGSSGSSGSGSSSTSLKVPDSLSKETSSSEDLKAAAEASKQGVKAVSDFVADVLYTDRPKNGFQRLGNKVAEFLRNDSVSARLADWNYNRLITDGPSNSSSGYWYKKHYEDSKKSSSSGSHSSGKF